MLFAQRLVAQPDAPSYSLADNSPVNPDTADIAKGMVLNLWGFIQKNCKGKVKYGQGPKDP